LSPIKIPDNLPAGGVLAGENIFVMTESRAYAQDIRPLKIAVVNLMPNKQETEVQLLRLLANTPLQVDVTLLHMESRRSKHTSAEYLAAFYSSFSDIADRRFDGCVITGAPVEKLKFEEVGYWPELVKIMDWTAENVTSTLHICWGAQAGLYRHYGVPKRELPEKMFGVFAHTRAAGSVNILKGFDETFYVPHSRHTTVFRRDIERVEDLEILAESEESGVYLVMSRNGRRLFALGHAEYDGITLHNEYVRDKAKGLAISPPKNYYQDENPEKPPVVRWRSSGNLLFTNWLNYYVYQETPYDLDDPKAWGRNMYGDGI
jgi:homoserine O-succinyltransferase